MLSLIARLGRSGVSGRIYLVGGATAVLLGWRERSRLIVRDLGDVRALVEGGEVDPASLLRQIADAVGPEPAA